MKVNSEEHCRLMELIGRIRDGRLDQAQTAELETLLRGDPDALEYYVESIDLISQLHRQQGLTPADETNPRTASESEVGLTPEPKGRWQPFLWSLGIAASLMIGVFSGRTLGPRQGRGFTPDAAGAAVSAIEREIATLSFASGCRWQDSEVDRFEGQRLVNEVLSLEEGVAVIQFDCDVRLVLEGPSRLQLMAIDHAKLQRGQAVFSGDGDLERFTLETPFSKIQDEGTEYAVRVEPSGAVEEIHVFDGRVIRHSADSESAPAKQRVIALDAGQARRFAGTGQSEPISLAAEGFVRTPKAIGEASDSEIITESFDYAGVTFIGKEGGDGWRGAWNGPAGKSSLERTAAKLVGQSIDWPEGAGRSAGGSVLVEGTVGMHRRLKMPIRMNVDAAYYLSFLVRKQATSVSENASGWGYFTLRNSEEKAGHIAIGPITQRGAPRIVHDACVANVTSPLRDETAYLFVCKILARREKDDQLQVRIYGDHESVDDVEPTAWSLTMRPVDNDAVLNELRLSARNCLPIRFDEFRIGKTWASVTAPYSIAAGKPVALFPSVTSEE